MTRRLLNLLTAMSLLLCIAPAALWVRCHFRTDWWDCEWHTSTDGRWGTRTLSIVSEGRRLGIEFDAKDYDSEVGATNLDANPFCFAHVAGNAAAGDKQAGGPSFFDHLGFSFGREPRTFLHGDFIPFVHRAWRLTIPFWSLTAAGWLPAVRYRRRRPDAPAHERAPLPIVRL